MNFGHLVLSLAFAFSTSAATSTPLTYDEGIDGDIDITRTNLSLGIGANAIHGTLRSVIILQNGQFVSSDFDADGFRFTIPAGSVLTSAAMNADFVDTTGNTGFFEVIWVLFDENASHLAEPCITFEGTRLNCDGSFSGGTFFSGTPSASSSYTMGNPSAIVQGGLGPFETSGGDIPYTFLFNVSAVPEPASSLLSCIGLLMILAAHRRRIGRHDRECLR